MLIRLCLLLGGGLGLVGKQRGGVVKAAALGLSRGANCPLPSLLGGDAGRREAELVGGHLIILIELLLHHVVLVRPLKRLQARGRLALLHFAIFHPVLQSLDVGLLPPHELAQVAILLVQVRLRLGCLNLLAQLLQIGFVVVHVCYTVFE